MLSRRGLAPAVAAIAALLIGAWAVGAWASAAKPPQIAFTSPKDGTVTQEQPIEVAGIVTVAPFDGPSPRVTATLDGRPLKLGVRGAVKYDFETKVSLDKGANEITVEVDDGDGGKASKSIAVRYVPVKPTRKQCV